MITSPHTATPAQSAVSPATISGRRDGFSLAEVVITMVILAVIISSLGALTAVTARRSLVAANSAGRQAFTLQEANRIAAMPYASLPAMVGCDTATGGTLRYRRCTTVTAGTRYRDVMVVVTPLRSGTYADTVRLRRVITATNNPLFTP